MVVPPVNAEPAIERALLRVVTMFSRVQPFSVMVMQFGFSDCTDQLAASSCSWTPTGGVNSMEGGLQALSPSPLHPSLPLIWSHHRRHRFDRFSKQAHPPKVSARSCWVSRGGLALVLGRLMLRPPNSRWQGNQLLLAQSRPLGFDVTRRVAECW